MKIFIPAGAHEIEEKLGWFKGVFARKLSSKGVSFGFELKYPLSSTPRDFEFGVHLPNNLATDWFRRMNNAKEREALKSALGLRPKPLYAVLHGARVGSVSVDPEKEYPDRYVSLVNAIDYICALQGFILLVKYAQELGLPIAVENTAIPNFQLDGVWKPRTFLDLRIGHLSRDLLWVKNATGCQLVTDTDHLAFSYNFATAKGLYKGLNGLDVNCFNQFETREEQLLSEELGILLRQNVLPLFQTEPSFWTEIEKIGAEVFHLTGGVSEASDWMDIYDGKIASHAPITYGNRHISTFLDFVLGMEAKSSEKIIVVEVSGPSDKCPDWSDRSPNAQKESFENVCRMLLEKI